LSGAPVAEVDERKLGRGRTGLGEGSDHLLVL